MAGQSLQPTGRTGAGRSDRLATVRPMRLIVARCEVVYTGRLNARLPEALRLLMIKSDGSVMVHADHGGYKPSNWMTPPAGIEEAGEAVTCSGIRKRAGGSGDRLAEPRA